MEQQKSAEAIVGLLPQAEGLRPRRSAGQAVKQARNYLEAGYRWGIDLDLEKFFDRVKHAILLARLARKVNDKCVLKLIRDYLEAGVCAGGLLTARSAGWLLTPSFAQDTLASMEAFVHPSEDADAMGA